MNWTGSLSHSVPVSLSGADLRATLGGPWTLQKIIELLQNIFFIYILPLLDPVKF
jgi:hypothetical protein